MAKPTAGPWRVDGSGHCVRTANVDGKPRSGEEGGNWMICKVADVFMDGGQREGNARLIAAAPDLLDFAVRIQAFMDRGLANVTDEQWDEAKGDVDELIAKATS